MKCFVSVRELAEFVYSHGDLRSQLEEPTTAKEGVDLQRLYQDAVQASDLDYQREVRLRETVTVGEMQVTVSGRADGFADRNGESCMIEEIKTARVNPEKLFTHRGNLHLAQARIYGAMACAAFNAESVDIRLTYLHPDSEAVSTREFRELRKTLRQVLMQSVGAFACFISTLRRRIETRNSAAREQRFPYPAYRLEQHETARAVYRCLRDGDHLLMDIPTGSGKTITTVFPAIKALGEGVCNRIVYATSRTTGKTIAEKTLVDLSVANPSLVAVTLSAKDQVCLTPGAPCEPESCTYAKGYFNKLPRAREELLGGGVVTEKSLTAVAKTHGLCPYRLGMDVAEWSDVVICDYNHVFDPFVKMQKLRTRHFRKVALLVDEAHGLADRVCDSLSASLSVAALSNMAHILAGSPRSLVLSLADELVRQSVSHLGEKEDEVQICGLPDEFWQQLQRLTEDLPAVNSELWENTQFREFAFALAHLRILRGVLRDHDFVQLLDRKGDDVCYSIRCLLAAEYIRDIMKSFSSSIRFSGTLSPARLYQRTHGIEGEALTAPPPFDRSNVRVLVVPSIQTAFRRRERSAGRLAQLILSCQRTSPGNWLVALPSYAYLNMVAVHLRGREGLRAQERSMSSKQRDEFIAWLNKGTWRVGLIVAGSMFAESVDYDGDVLMGAMVVGPCLPPPSLKQELMLKHPELGDEIASLLPGMRKAVQAAGRIVRSENQRGVVVLVDPRFAKGRFQEYFPSHWDPEIVPDRRVAQEVRSFFEPGKLRWSGRGSSRASMDACARVG